MCFSATADLVAATAVAPVGLLALRWAPTRADLPLASLPLLFAVHQGIEALVWLGFDGRVSAELQHVAIAAYLVIAQVVLPLLVPIGVLAIEPVPWRRRLMLLPLVAGAATAVWFMSVFATDDLGARPEAHAVVYDTDYRIGVVLSVLYGVSTLGAIFLTSRRPLLWLGIVNAIGFAGAALVRYESVTSVWCVYAALTSAVVLLHLDARRRELTSPEWREDSHAHPTSRK